jgi:alpha-D-ribose 1-methylphosphonate 5-triphosphate synthase subunit PhnI
VYVAVKGGEQAIEAAHAQLAEERRGDPAVPELTLAQIEQQLGLAVDRVMTEGSLYDRELAALAIKQARGDLVEAIFLLCAYRTTLPRHGVSLPAAVATVSRTPAERVGLDDRGEIAAGKRADLIRVRATEDVPVVGAVWVAGARVA